MIRAVAAQTALDEARRRLDVQLDTVESLRNRGLAMLGVVGIVGGVAGAPSSDRRLAVLVVLAAGALAALVVLLWDREFRSVQDPVILLDHPDWQLTAEDEVRFLEQLARRQAATYERQATQITALVWAHRVLLVLTLVLTVLFIAWGKTS